MNGAYFRKCDFQIHTPRDCQFNGREYVLDSERADYANLFITSCREKGLDAIAITDHHDLYFYRYIREAAIHEGELKHILSIQVFPGMELTLNVPCQALLLLDAMMDLSDDLIIKIYTSLGINNSTSRNTSKTATTERLEIDNVNEVSDRLSQIPEIKNRFIILPNVARSGSDTILREGCFLKYANASFVGGYLDNGQYKTHKTDVGWNNIINGKTDAYGKRSIGIFQTSDCRSDSFTELGLCYSYVKLAEFTAEGIRQACLAKYSRIRQEEPVLPSIYIESIEIHNSSVMADTILTLSREFNTLIGGRGVGKSSIIQYIIYALGRENEPSKSEALEFGRNTLKDDGYVKLIIIKNGAKYTITRSKAIHTLSIGANKEETTSGQLLSSLIEIEVFLQKELSKHGSDREDQVLRMLRYPIHDKFDEIERQLTINKNEIKELLVSLNTIEDLKKEKLELKNVLASKNEEIASLQEHLLEVTPEDRKTISDYTDYQKEKSLLNSIIENINNSRDELERAFASINPIRLDSEHYSHNDQIEEAVKVYSEIWDNYKRKLGEIGSLFSDSKIKSVLSELKDDYDKNEEMYITVSNKVNQQQAAISAFTEAEKDVSSYKHRIDELEFSISKSKISWKQLLGKYKKRFDLVSQIFALQRDEAAIFSGDKTGEISISFNGSIDYSEFENKLNDLISNARNQKERMHEFFDVNIGKDAKMYRIYEILLCIGQSISHKCDLHEVFKRYRYEDSMITDQDRKRIVESISIDALIDLSLTTLTSIPTLKYNKLRNLSIPFSDASYGQQSSALLSMLMKQRKGPLIIDQPEDDLDNKIISAFAEEIINSKENRQILFATHNANIVVNGDSELVSILEFNEQKSSCIVKAEGAIDCNIIRKEIEDIMEGGEKAFILRKRKYGF